MAVSLNMLMWVTVHWVRTITEVGVRDQRQVTAKMNPAVPVNPEDFRITNSTWQLFCVYSKLSSLFQTGDINSTSGQFTITSDAYSLLRSCHSLWASFHVSRLHSHCPLEGIFEFAFATQKGNSGGVLLSLA